MEKNHTCMKIKETNKYHYPYTPQRKQETPPEGDRTPNTV